MVQSGGRLSADALALCALLDRNRASRRAVRARDGMDAHAQGPVLPGVTTLERFVAQVRSRMEARLWRLLARGVTDEQRSKLESLLTIAEGSRQLWLDKLRKGPVRVSAPALVRALQRVETIRELGITLPAAAHIPRSRLAALARFAGTVKVTVLNRLPPARQLAVLVAFVHSMEASAQDDALDLLGMLLRSLKDLDKAAATLADACRLLLDPDVSDANLRERVYEAIGRDVLTQALDDVSALVRPPDDVFYDELHKKRRSGALPADTVARHVVRSECGRRAPCRCARLVRQRPVSDPPEAR